MSKRTQPAEARGPLLQVAHAVPGRLRLRLRELREAPPERAGAIADALVHEDGILDVSVSLGTGSILVLYDESRLAEHEVAALVQKATGASRVLEPGEELPRRADGPYSKEPSRLALATATFFEEMNEDVRRATEGQADLATLMPLAFVGLGLLEVGATREIPAPPWWSLFWWSFRSFLSLNDPAIRQAAGAAEAAPEAASA